MAAPARPFPTMLELPTRLSRPVWDVLRVLTTLGSVGLVVVLLVAPQTGLDALWGVIVPLLPPLWLVAPGLWRNLCPLASANQAPRRFGFTRGLTAPDWFRDAAPVVGIVLFLAAVASRPVLFNHDATASAALVGSALVFAFIGGTVLKGKSGWCSSICPLLPVQRVYAQTPYVTVPNTHCAPCVGCTKHCYDFNPRVALLADLHDEDRHLAHRRLLFAGILPAVVLAYFTTPGDLGTGETYARFGLAILAGAGAIFALAAVLRVALNVLTASAGTVAFALYTWWAPAVLCGTLLGDRGSPVVWVLRAAGWAAVALWYVRTLRKEAIFQRERAAPVAGTGTESGEARFGGTTALDTIRKAQAGNPEVTFAASGLRVVAKPGQSLLDVAEGSEQRIESGCRMGACGADPVCVLEGAEHLSPIGDNEFATLSRLGHGPRTRMACCAQVRGPVTVALEPDREGAAAATGPEPGSWDPEVEHVVVIGNGIAGVTTADHVRRRHPDCTIDIVAAEPHPLYNRMGIARLVHGRSAMVGLHLLEDGWDEAQRITAWLNTRANAIDRDRRVVVLATGEELPYDRLVLATGARARVGDVPGWGLPGTSVLRRADDALEIRTFAQEHGARTAAVSGGGLLGLEAAHALRRLGLSTTVLERGPWLLRRQLDRRAAGLLQSYLEGLGITVLVDAAVDHVEGDDRVRAVVLADGRRVDAELVVAATGITPEVALARDAGIEVGRAGVVVDDAMRTSDPLVYAVGDVAEHRGKVLGLWPAGVEQAEAAAENLTGGEREYLGTIPVTMLKVVGIDVLSCGRFDAAEGDEVLVHEDVDARTYAKLVLHDGRLEGAILLGHPTLAGAASAAVKAHEDLGPVLERLRAGELEALDPAAAVPA